LSSEFVNVTESAHKVLGQGNLVLMMSEGLLDGKPTVFYDFYRLEEGKQVEHWDVLETIPLRAQGKNSLIAKKSTSSEKEIPELGKEI
jgi:predicted SnoaL-like aldol condensation-catalyzing enzyme